MLCILKPVLTLEYLVLYIIGQWSNLLRKTEITITFYFAPDKENVYIRKKRYL